MQCKKKTFETHAAAGKFLGYLRKKMKWEEAAKLEPYVCRICRKWHLGHKSDIAEIEKERRLRRLANIDAEEDR
jgi:hypothetical protein